MFAIKQEQSDCGDIDGVSGSKWKTKELNHSSQQLNRASQSHEKDIAQLAENNVLGNAGKQGKRLSQRQRIADYAVQYRRKEAGEPTCGTSKQNWRT